MTNRNLWSPQEVVVLLKNVNTCKTYTEAYTKTSLALGRSFTGCKLKHVKIRDGENVKKDTNQRAKLNYYFRKLRSLHVVKSPELLKKRLDYLNKIKDIYDERIKKTEKKLQSSMDKSKQSN